MLCRETELLEQIEALKNELAYWKDEARVRVDNERLASLSKALRLSDTEAWVLSALRTADGKPVSRLRLMEDHPGKKSAEERDSNVVQVFISRIRAKLGADTIETVRSRGYAITATGAAIHDSVFTDQGEKRCN